MFLPQDMTPGEKDLAATIARQLLDQLPQTATEDDRRATRLRAQEIAGEQIWQSRSASTSTEEEELDLVPPEEWPYPDNGGMEMQALLDEMNEELFRAEED